MAHPNSSKGSFSLYGVIVLACTIAAHGQGAVPELLLPESTVVRTLRGAGRERFRIDLRSGDFLLISVDQRDIDVSLAVVDIDGSDSVVRDSPNAENGPECVAFIASSTGTYHLDVRSLDDSSAVTAGTIAIRVEAVRPATPGDREHAEADRLFYEAVQLRVQNTALARAQALERLAPALAAYERLDRRYEAAMALHSTGLTHLRGGETRRAIPFLERAAASFRDLGSPMFASTINALGGTDDLLGNTSSAIDRYQQALLYFRASGSATGEGLARNNLGKLFSDTADWQRALEQYRQALSLFAAAGDRNREGLALYNIGMSYASLGEGDQALAHLSRALAIWTTYADRSREAEVLTSMGWVELTRRQPQRALEHLHRALSLRQLIGDGRTEGATRTFIGQAYLDLNQVDEAVKHLEHAVDLRRAVDKRGTSLTLLALSRAYTADQRPERARAVGLEALAAFHDLGDRNGAAGALKRVAEAEQRLGRVDDAIEHNEEALRLIEAVRGGVASPELRAGYFGRQNNLHDGLIHLLMRRSARDGNAGDAARSLEVSERARARSLLEMIGESATDMIRGVDDAMIARERQLADLINVKSERVMPLVARDRGSAAAQTMLQEIAELEAEYGEVRAHIRKSSPAYAALTQPEPLRVSAIQRDLLDATTRLIEYSLGDEASYAWVVDRQSLRGIHLSPREEIERAARDVTEHVTARGISRVGETTAQRDRRVAAASAALPAALRRLSDLVVVPLGDLSAGSRLLVVADGALQYIPFGMLPGPSANGIYRPLIVDHEIVTMPSASVLSVQRQQLKMRTSRGSGVAVIADPVFDRTDARLRIAPSAPLDLPVSDSGESTRILEHLGQPAPAAKSSVPSRAVIPRLPFTRNEADAILAAAKGQRNFRAVDFAATKEAVLGGALRSYRIVHFATHGFLDTERPTLSSIVLSLVDEDGQPLDGFLRAQELYNLDLNADLVVLSACQTGLGKSIEGEGLIGLTRGLMYAGAQRVVVSLWNVSDRATASLMSRFYRDMLTAGKPPSAALRAAQLEVMKIKGWENPFYWAPFVMQGDWR